MAEEAGLPRVVVVGAGGFAGRRALRVLRREGAGVLRVAAALDAETAGEYTPGALRCLVEPAHAARIRLPLPMGATPGAQVVALEPGGVARLADGGAVGFDYALVATGSAYAAPVRTTPSGSREAVLRGAARALREARAVVVVGGGTVGVELAAEVAGRYGRAKALTLVAGSDRLLPRMPPAAGAAARRWLEARGCAVLCGERVAAWGGARSGEPGSHTLETEGGRRLACDLAYDCAGARAVAPHGLGGAPADVDPRTLRAAAGPDGGVVFACGDCAGTAEEKTALSADLGATLAARNIIRAARGEPLLQFPEDVCAGAAAVPAIACVSLHRWCAVMQFNELVLCGALPALVKWLIEFLNVRAARGSALAEEAWVAIETVNVWLAARLFLPSQRSWLERRLPRGLLRRLVATTTSPEPAGAE